MRVANPDNLIVNAIREAFKASGWSIKRLSDESKVAYMAVHSVVKGERDVSSWTASRLFAALGLQVRPVRRVKKA